MRGNFPGTLFNLFSSALTGSSLRVRMEARLGAIYRSVSAGSGATMSAVASSSAPLRVCVVGGGSISREFAMHHFGDATNTKVAAIVDLNEERALQLATDVGSVQAGAVVEDKGTKYR